MAPVVDAGAIDELPDRTIVSVRAGELEQENPVIACPWHKYEFSLKDGHCLTNAGLRVRSYPVTVEDGRVLVDMGGNRGKAGGPAQSP
jgi:nitrite reductase/ring-hydroxylating ferredoxin subunit